MIGAFFVSTKGDGRHRAEVNGAVVTITFG